MALSVQAGLGAVTTAPPRPAARRSAGRRRRDPGRWIVLVFLAVLALGILLPLVVVVVNALKPATEYAASGPLALPKHPALTNLTDFWTRVDYGRKLWNSVLISGSVAVLAVVLSLFNAYALGVGKVRGRLALLVAFIAANVLPQEALIYPLYFLAKKLDLYDTRLSVIIIFTVIQTAFGTYLLSAVLGRFPRELLEAARLDGAGTWRTLWQVVVPISRPTLAVLLVFFFVWTWNEFFIPLIFLLSNDNQTVSVALGVLQGQRLMDATMSSASAVLGMVPTIVFFLIFQRTLSRGITMGAIK
jgi:raffinose/stachyose/melibiose transport system permease protein